jgi:hypothetical protein
VIDGAERELNVHVTAARGRARLPVLRRAVAGACSQAGLTVDRIDDAVLVLEALLADPVAANADEVHLVLTARPGSLSLVLGPLPGEEAARLLREASLPLVGPVVARLASSACTIDDGSHLLVVVEAR